MNNWFYIILSYLFGFTVLLGFLGIAAFRFFRYFGKDTNHGREQEE